MGGGGVRRKFGQNPKEQQLCFRDVFPYIRWIFSFFAFLQSIWLIMNESVNIERQDQPIIRLEMSSFSIDLNVNTVCTMRCNKNVELNTFFCYGLVILRKQLAPHVQIQLAVFARKKYWVGGRCRWVCPSCCIFNDELSSSGLPHLNTWILEKIFARQFEVCLAECLIINLPSWFKQKLAKQ